MPKEKASKKVKSSVASAKAKVNRLAREYKAKQAELDEYFGEYADIMAEYERLAVERNIALDKLKRACKEAKISAGPFTVSVAQTRVIDGGYLYETLDDSIRDEVVEVVYKVNTKKFDEYIQSGHIIAKIAQKSVLETKETTKALNGPKEIVMG